MGLKTYQLKKSNPHPHIGSMVEKVMKTKGISKAELARQMGLSGVSIGFYLKHHSLQFGILWDLGIALKHDFLSEIMNHYPPDFPLNENSLLLQELNEKKAKILDLEKEIEIYKNALGIRK